MTFEEWVDQLYGDLGQAWTPTARAAWDHQQKRVDELEKEVAEHGDLMTIAYLRGASDAKEDWNVTTDPQLDKLGDESYQQLERKLEELEDQLINANSREDILKLKIEQLERKLEIAVEWIRELSEDHNPCGDDVVQSAKSIIKEIEQ